MTWLMRFLRWVFGRKAVESTFLPLKPPREHHRSRLHRGWHREPKRPPWCKSSKLTSGVR
jgi:hypothetical protein